MIDALLLELDNEFKTTRGVLQVVPEDKFGWRPHEKSMTLGRLATHVAQLPGWAAATVPEGGCDLAEQARVQPTTTAEVLQIFDDGASALKAMLKAAKIEELAGGSYELKAKGKTMLKLPRIGFVRFIALNHHYHHRGQLSVYLRLLDVPVPSIYGPSADTNPWG
jgi:uncharacterized damage-inducible protein DinB